MLQSCEINRASQSNRTKFINVTQIRCQSIAMSFAIHHPNGERVGRNGKRLAFIIICKPFYAMESNASDVFVIKWLAVTTGLFANRSLDLSPLLISISSHRLRRYNLLLTCWWKRVLWRLELLIMSSCGNAPRYVFQMRYTFAPLSSFNVKVKARARISQYQHIWK